MYGRRKKLRLTHTSLVELRFGLSLALVATLYAWHSAYNITQPALSLDLKIIKCQYYCYDNSFMSTVL